jgi:hypothetical protein
MEAIYSPETSVHTRSTRRHIPEDGILHSHRCENLKSLIIILSGVRLSPLGTAATTGLLYQPQMINDGDCGVIGGMKIGRGNRSTRRKPAPATLCPLQIPHYHARAQTRSDAVGNQRLTS